MAHRVILVAALLVAGCVAPPPPPAPTKAPTPLAPPKSEPLAQTPPKSEPAPQAPPKSEPPPQAPPKKVAVAPAKPRAAPPPPSPAPTPPPPPAKPSAPPPLDLKSLEHRLKETNAIGVLTKLSLKNQVDDLVERFKAFHQGQRPPSLAELRPSFELLLMKVLSLLQDKDAALARDINASREAIWGVLTDRQKLSQYS